MTRNLFRRTRGPGRARAIVVGAVVAAGALVLVSAQTPDGPALTVPEGFEVVRAAGPSLVNRPIVADFDEEGRLYVADASGTNAPVEQQLREKPHRIVRLEDADGDGVFDRHTVFADGMMLPQGTLWHDGSLYVAAPPSIWKLTDTDGDGVADAREEWFAGKTLTGCANDLHGPYRGPDGWIYWTKGAFAEQTYELPAGPLVTRAAHVFRRRPGDGMVEPVMTGGMDNPVDVAFTPAGDRILTATFLEHPQLGRRDALIHAVYGGVYGKPHAVIDGHVQTGDLLPAVCHLGPAAPSGLTRYASRAFGEEYRDNFFAALFNMRKVTRHVLEPRGSTFTSRDSDFLSSDDLDFHPTDVVEDADGSLLVIDTGGWYKLCCPTSQLAKPEVLGAIYRVRKRGAAPPADPRGRGIDWPSLAPDALTTYLDDPRPAVRERAVQRLSALGSEALPALGRVLDASASGEARLNAVWALTRMPSGDARAAVRGALDDGNDDVRRAALHAVGLWRDVEAMPALLSVLEAGSPAGARAAAEALGRIGDRRAVPALLAAASRPLDRVGEHSVIFALVEIADPAATAEGLDSSSALTRRRALVALDQMRGATLDAARVVPLLESPDGATRDAAWWVAGHHPEWGDILASFFATRLASPLDDAERGRLQEKLATFAGTAAVQELLGASAAGASPSVRATALRAMAAARQKQLPAAWVRPLAATLASAEHDVAALAVAALRAAPASEEGAKVLRPALLRLAHDASRPVTLRLDALGAVPGGLADVDEASFALLVAALDRGQPVPVRLAAAALVEKAALNDRQLRALADVVKDAGPLELPRLLPAFDRGADESVGLALVTALEQAKSRTSLRPDLVRPRLAKYPAAVQARGDALLATLRTGSAAQADTLESLLRAVSQGDRRRGQLLFNSPKAACNTCHAMGYRGGKLGPDLTAIGQIRSERDLLEAIVFPGVSFARGYEPVVVTTRSGEAQLGVLRQETADEVVLAVGEGQEARFPRSTIATIEPATVSLMPSGYDEQLSRQELADLVVFLKGTKWGPD